MAFLQLLAYAILMNAIPLIEVIVHDRSPAVLLLLYWFETVLLLITGTIRIVAHRRATQKAGHYAPINITQDHNAGAEDARRSLDGPNTYLRGLLNITVIFTIAHGMFVLLLVFLFRIAGPVSWQDARLALIYVIFVQGLFLLWDLPRLHTWTFAQLSKRVGTASLRVLVTQLGLIFGLPMIAVTGSPWGLVGTFVAFRSLADASIAWLEGLLKQHDLPPGLARVLSRTSKQSPQALEAEFDALKAKGKDVEALLELPIDEARAPSAPATAKGPLQPSPLSVGKKVQG